MLRYYGTFLAENIPWALAGLLFIPYLLWGIYILRRQEPLRPRIQGVTVALLVVFFLVEHHLLLMWLANAPLEYVFALLGLYLSGAALYGSMAVSLVTHLLVDQMMPARGADVLEPEYGAGEACERLGDLEGAVREYTAVARMFPKDPTAALRIADNLMKLDQPKAAVEWLEQGLRCLDSPERSLSVTNRLFEIYLGTLEEPERARRTLDAYVAKFPEAEYAHSVRERLRGLGNGAPQPRAATTPPASRWERSEPELGPTPPPASEDAPTSDAAHPADAAPPADVRPPWSDAFGK